MTSISPDNPLLSYLTTEEFVEYLTSNGWRVVPYPNQQLLLFEGAVDDIGKPIKLILPSDEGFDDAPLRFSEAINLISAIQNISPEEIISEITTHQHILAYSQVERTQRHSNTDESHWWPIPLLSAIAIVAAIIFLPTVSPELSQKIFGWINVRKANFIPVVSAAQADMPIQNWKTCYVKSQDNSGVSLEVVIGVL